MAIAHDAVANGWVASGTTTTYSHTCTGSDLAILNGMYTWNSIHTISSSTYNGVSMTELGQRAADQTGGKITIFGLAGPSTGTNSMVATISATGQMFVNSSSYTGVDQTTPFPDTATTGVSSGTSLTQSITTTVDQSWVFACGRSPSRAPTAGTDTVVRELNDISGDAAWLIDSGGARSTGSNNLAWSYAPSQTTYRVMTAIAPAGGGSTAHTQDLTEIMTLTDTLSRTPGRTFNDIATLNDAIVKATGSALNESVSLVDSIVRITTKSLLESLAFTDTVRRTISLVLLDVVALTDTVATSIAKTIHELLSLTDRIQRTIGVSISNTLTLVDSVLRGTSKFIANQLSLTDSFTGSVPLLLLDTLTVVDTVAVVVAKNLRDTLTLVDSLTRSITRTIAETLTLVDVLDAGILAKIARVGTTVLTSAREIIGGTVLQSKKEDGTVLRSKK